MDTPAPPRTVPLLAGAIILAAVGVNVPSLLFPLLLHDDFEMVLKAWTWDATRTHLWAPMNEHCLPLTRLTTYAMVQLAGRPTALPWAAMLFTHLQTLATVGLVYLFARRERGHVFFGLLAMAVFGVSAAYQEVIYWYTASPALSALATGLLALLAAQRWVRTEAWWALLLTGVWCALAPAWIAGGVLAAPLCSLYLLGRGSGRARWWAWLVPLIGCGAWLAVSLPLAGKQILNTAHYDGKTAVQAFSPTAAVENTGRALVDNVLLGSVGVFRCPMPGPVVIVGLVAIAAVLAWRWQHAGDRRLILLGLAFIVLNYLLIFGARAGWSYATQLSVWSRYNVFPQCGLALLVCGAVGPRGASLSPGLSRGQAQLIGFLTLALFVTQCPRGWFGGAVPVPEQMAVLREVEAVDRQCVERHISADDARRVLKAADVPMGQYNRWLYLWGSPTPRPMSDEELKRVLLGEGR